jgi:heparanase
MRILQQLVRNCQTCLSAVIGGVLTISCIQSVTAQMAVSPQNMKVLGEVDPRFVSYNVEAVEVTGGRFWAPYKSAAQKAAAAGSNKQSGNQPVGLDSSLFQYRPPIDLSNPKLRKLAAALGPACVRVSGTWRNATYFQNNDDTPLKNPPDGFNGVLTRAEWKDVVDFAKAVNAEIVASVATSAGTRDANGVWTAVQAKPWLDYTKRIGGHIAAIEFMNEPTLLSFGGVPKGYDAASFGRDAKIFEAFLRRESPATIYLGPGSAAEGLPLPSMPGGRRFQIVSTDDLMKATGPIFDAFSYHFYSMPSHRCLGENGADPKQVLTSDWLDRDLTVYKFYAKERDTYLPGKNLWLTETGEGSCGGDTWAAQFADSFRLLDQLGSLAQRSVKSIMYNTLASSDYGMLDEETLEPRPNYWAALLWKRTMGTRSLDPGVVPAKNVRVYAQCMKDSRGGVTLMVLNMDKTVEALLKLPAAGKRYSLSSPDLFSQSVLLNGKELKAEPNGTIPALQGEASMPGAMTFPPLSITFVEMPSAGNPQCGR